MKRPQQDIVSVRLPLPPSVNSAFASRGHSHRTMKTAAFRFWWRQVVEMHGCGENLPVFRNGAYCLWIDLPPGMHGDTDNRTKLISDVLKSPDKHGREGLAVVIDDAAMRDHMIHLCTGLPADQCVATVMASPMWPSYVLMRMT